MKQIYLARHGESEGNASGRWHGYGGSLTELGRKQAHFLGKRFAALPIEVLIASPVLRAKETAEAIAAETSLSIVYSDLFVEHRTPETLHGKEHHGNEARAILSALAEHVDDPKWHYGDEENLHELLERARSALAYLAARPEHNLGVVTHGNFLRAMVLCMLLGEDATSRDFIDLQRVLLTRNTGITIALGEEDEHYPYWRLLTWNDHAHLGEVDK